MNTKQRYCKTCSTKVDKGKSYCSKECRPSFYKYHFKQRYCKTCNIKVGKGKSYCSDSCRPSDYAMKTNNKNRKCKYGDCDKVVGKGKSYCKKCYVLKRRDEKRAKYIPVSEMTKEQHKEYTKNELNNASNRYSTDHTSKDSILTCLSPMTARLKPRTKNGMMMTETMTLPLTPLRSGGVKSK